MAKFGYNKISDTEAKFYYYAPLCESLDVEIDSTKQKISLKKDDKGYFSATVPLMKEGTLYWLIKNNDIYMPDPFSKRQPFDIHNASMVTYPIASHNTEWKGVDIKDAIIYELHLGTFTDEGTIKAATNKLNYIKSIGVNVIELLPICQFPGTRNWGYDGTYLYSIANCYGTLKDLHDFLETAHKLGIAVILDVVYNHFGPEGNYTGMLANFMKKEQTPWGAAINFDQEDSQSIREIYLDNTEYWLREVGFDGFRMDAVSNIFDNSKVHILTEINDLRLKIEKEEGRRIINIAEHLRNKCWVTEENGAKFDSQWTDDLTYALNAYLSGERFRSFGDFGELNYIDKILRESFAYDGTKYNCMMNCNSGEDGRNIEPHKLVVYSQNHDQIGNRPKADRFIATNGIDKALLATSVVFASPFTPMIFMGEEYGEMNPFYFFECYLDCFFIEGVKMCRQRDFEDIKDYIHKDSHDVNTFIQSKLDWESQTEPTNSDILEFYKAIISLKKSNIIGQRTRDNLVINTDFNKSVIYIENDKSITICNFSDKDYKLADLNTNGNTNIILTSKLSQKQNKDTLFAYSAIVLAK